VNPDLIRAHADLLRQLRAFNLSRIADLSDEQLLIVPDGFANNLLWNLAHVVVSQQLLIYGRSGLPLYVDERMISENRKGTSPQSWTTPPDIAQVKALFFDLPARMADDADRFEAYDAYPTSTGVTLGTLDDALRFSLYHEGLHGGAMATLLRFV
jgi:hypothetical protein